VADLEISQVYRSGRSVRSQIRTRIPQKGCHRTLKTGSDTNIAIPRQPTPPITPGDDLKVTLSPPPHAPGLQINSVYRPSRSIRIRVRIRTWQAARPRCGTVSQRMLSRHERRVSDAVHKRRRP